MRCFQVVLTESLGSAWSDTSVENPWNDVELEQPIGSSFVRLTVVSVYNTANNGFMEVQVFSYGGEYNSMIGWIVS